MSYKGDLFAFHFLCARQKKLMPTTLFDKICQTKNLRIKAFFTFSLFFF